MDLRLETKDVDEIEIFKTGWQIPDIKKPTALIQVNGKVYYKYADDHPLGVL